MAHATTSTTTRFALVLACAGMLCGCGLWSRRYAGPAGEAELATVPNPMLVPVTSVDLTWDQIIDMVDDYFEIAREVRVQEVGGVLMEGRIENAAYGWSNLPRAVATGLDAGLREMAQHAAIDTPSGHDAGDALDRRIRSLSDRAQRA